MQIQQKIPKKKKKKRVLNLRFVELIHNLAIGPSPSRGKEPIAKNGNAYENMRRSIKLH